MTDADEDKLRKQALADIELLRSVVADATVIAHKRGYDCAGWEALYLLFADRFSWTPEQVRSLRIPELSWMLETFF